MKKIYIRKAAGIIGIAMAAALLLTACGAAKSKAESGMYMREEAVAETAAAAAAMDYAEPKMAGAAYGVNSAADMAYDTGTGVTGNVSGISEAEAAAAQEGTNFGKLIRTVSISLETKEFDQLSASIRERVRALGGYIESASEYSRYNDLRGGYMTVRIPQDRLDEFLDTALTAGTVISKSENVEDITLTYSDIKTRVETLKVEQSRLLDLLAKADDVESLIAIESRLSEISYEIENNASRLKVYDNRVSYSTVNIDISEVKVTAPTVEASLGEKIISGIEQNLVDVTAFLGGLLFAIVIHLPAIIIFALLVFAIVMFIRKFRAGSEDRKAKRAAKKAAKAEAKQQKKAAKAAAAGTANTGAAEAKAAAAGTANTEAAMNGSVAESSPATANGSAAGNSPAAMNGSAAGSTETSERADGTSTK